MSQTLETSAHADSAHAEKSGLANGHPQSGNVAKAPRIKGLKCKCCDECYELAPKHVCEFCFGPLEVEYDYEVIAQFGWKAPSRVVISIAEMKDTKIRK